MKLIIDIPDEAYASMVDGTFGEKYYPHELFTMVAKGTPLPKGCGRLIDADALENEFDMLEKITNEESLVEKAEHKKLSECVSIIKTAPTIVEADSRGDEKLNKEANDETDSRS